MCLAITLGDPLTKSVCTLGSLVVWNPLSLDPFEGVFACLDIAALLRVPDLECLIVCFVCDGQEVHVNHTYVS